MSSKICKSCYEEKDINEFEPNRLVCKSCRKKQVSKSRQKLYANRKQKGLCTKCGNKAIEGYLYCSSCYDKKRKIAKKMTLSQSPEKRILYGARTRAKKQSLECNLTYEDIKIPDKCPILGIPIFTTWTGKCGPNYNSPTIDRLDNTKGYTRDNINIISWRANRIKKDATLEELILIGKWAKNKKENKS